MFYVQRMWKQYYLPTSKVRRDIMTSRSRFAYAVQIMALARGQIFLLRYWAVASSPKKVLRGSILASFCVNNSLESRVAI